MTNEEILKEVAKNIATGTMNSIKTTAKEKALSVKETLEDLIDQINPMNHKSDFIEATPGTMPTGNNGRTYGAVQSKLSYVYHGENLLVFLEVPGFSKSTLKITVADGIIKVTGETEKYKGKTVNEKIELAEDFEYDIERISAACENGILAITVPMTVAKTNEIKID